MLSYCKRREVQRLHPINTHFFCVGQDVHSYFLMSKRVRMVRRTLGWRQNTLLCIICKDDMSLYVLCAKITCYILLTTEMSMNPESFPCHGQGKLHRAAKRSETFTLQHSPHLDPHCMSSNLLWSRKQVQILIFHNIPYSYWSKANRNTGLILPINPQHYTCSLFSQLSRFKRCMRTTSFLEAVSRG